MKRETHAKFTALAFVFAFAASQSARASEPLYVSTDGDDANPGTRSLPLRTTSAAGDRVEAGGTVIVLGGVYTDTVVLKKSGTADAPIRILASSDGPVVIDGSTLPPKTDLVSIYGHHVVFEGFELRNGNAHGIVAWQTAHVSLIDNRIHDTANAGVFVGGENIGASHDNIVRGNKVYHTCLMNADRRSNNWPGALSINHSARALVVGNDVHENYGEGIDVYLSSGAQIVDNVTFDNFSMNIYLDNALEAHVEGNFSYGTGNPNFMLKRTQRPIGIGTAIEPYNTGHMPLTGLLIENNVVVGTRYGFYYGAYGRGGGLRDVRVVKNTFAGATDAALHIAADRHAGNLFANNVFAPTPGAAVAEGGGRGLDFHRNCWRNPPPRGFSSSDDVVGDPGFVAEGALSERAYELAAASPCRKIDAGAKARAH